MTERICVYAVVSGATAPLRGVGVAGERLRRARVAGIDLVIGTVPSLPRPTAPALRRYHDAVCRLVETHGSVLPARYGTSAATLDELALAVRARRDFIRRHLRLVRHRVQMTVRIFARSDRRSDRGSESVQSRFRVRSEWGDGATQGRQYLRRRAAELQIPGAEPLRAAVKKWVRAEHSERHARGRLAGSMYHLIPRGSTSTYREALQRAARAADLTIVVTGPWPPYAFADGGW